MKKILKKIAVFFSFLGIVSAGCSSDNDNIEAEEESGNGTVTVQYRINAVNRPDINATTNEMMKSILLLIVNSGNEIEAMVDTELPGLQEEYLATVELTAGKKTIYGFANLTPDMRTEAGLDNIAIGNPIPDLSGALLSLPNGYETDEITGNYLPMSNQTIYTVTKVSGQFFSMELIRLLCKIRFTFSSEIGEDVLLEQLRISPLTDSPVYLLPRSSGIPVLPPGTTQADYTYNFPSGTTLADGGETQVTLYLNESEVAGDGWFQFWITMQYKDNTTSVEKMALTNTTYLNRNDYLDIPVIITDYNLELNVRTYPPIGGYPAIVTEENEEYRITFSGGGPFVIIPSLMRLSDNTIVSDTDTTWEFTYEGAPAGFFDVEPELVNGEILGTVKPTASGSVRVTLSVEVETAAGINRTISYMIIITQN